MTILDDTLYRSDGAYSKDRGLTWINPKDNINYEDTPIKPNHYKEGGMEPIEYMRMKMTKEQLEGFCLGNVLKYVSRYQHKNGIEDLKKAHWYLEELISITGE